MNLRIRFPQGRKITRTSIRQREIAAVAGSLITPACVMAYVVAIWRLAADIGIAAGSSLQGLFFHWQIWLALGLALQFGGPTINRRLSALARVNSGD